MAAAQSMGKKALLAMPHWLLLFLTIITYPPFPQLLPQLERGGREGGEGGREGPGREGDEGGREVGGEG